MMRTCDISFLQFVEFAIEVLLLSALIISKKVSLFSSCLFFVKYECKEIFFALFNMNIKKIDAPLGQFYQVYCRRIEYFYF